jgi:hypothetical protein
MRPRAWIAGLVAAAVLAGAAAAQTTLAPDFTQALLHGLDKVTARVTPIEARVGAGPVRFGTLEITVRRCQRNRPNERPERAAFVEIDEVDPATRAKKRVYAGWLFAASPSLAALEHPVYDVWLVDCR